MFVRFFDSSGVRSHRARREGAVTSQCQNLRGISALLSSKGDLEQADIARMPV